MSYYAITLPLKAGGNIGTSVFVKIDSGNDLTALQCVANDVSIGVSQSGTGTAPGFLGATALAAVAGDPITIYGPGCIVEVGVGTANIVRGFVKPDANGLAVQAVGGNPSSGYALESGLAGELVKIMVLPPGAVA